MIMIAVAIVFRPLSCVTVESALMSAPPPMMSAGVDPIAVFSAFATQIGGRHLIFDFTDAQKRLFAHSVTQRIILFGMFYFSTRSLKMAALLWAVYHLGLWVLLNEHNEWNIMPRKWLASEGFATAPEKNISRIIL